MSELLEVMSLKPLGSPLMAVKEGGGRCWLERQIDGVGSEQQSLVYPGVIPPPTRGGSWFIFTVPPFTSIFPSLPPAFPTLTPSVGHKDHKTAASRSLTDQLPPDRKARSL